MSAVALILAMVALVYAIQAGGMSSRPGLIRKLRNRKDCPHYSHSGRANASYMRCESCGKKRPN